MTDLRQFFVALWKHGKLQLTGDIIAVVFLVWSQVNGRIPAKPFWVLFILAFFWGAFNAWREEHGKVRPDPELEVMRPQFAAQLNMLNVTQLLALRYTLSCGDLDGRRLLMLWRRHDLPGDFADAESRLSEIATLTGFLQPDANAAGAGLPLGYIVNPVWKRFLYDWAATNTVEGFIPEPYIEDPS